MSWTTGDFLHSNFFLTILPASLQTDRQTEMDRRRKWQVHWKSNDYSPEASLFSDAGNRPAVAGREQPKLLDLESVLN